MYTIETEDKEALSCHSFVHSVIHGRMPVVASKFRIGNTSSENVLAAASILALIDFLCSVWSLLVASSNSLRFSTYSFHLATSCKNASNYRHRRLPHRIKFETTMLTPQHWPKLGWLNYRRHLG